MIPSRVRARAHANIALVKYWGKRDGPANAPASPSLSLALRELRTDTEVVSVRGRRDGVFLDGREADPVARRRIVDFLDEWRRRGLIRGRFSVTSSNNFPTAAGLASSASGFAALAAALSGFASRRIGQPELSRLARLGSGSAARSVPGGLAVLPAGPDPGARLLAPPGKVPWGMVVVLVSGAPPKVPSRGGMEHCRITSPYHAAWLEQSARDGRDAVAAVRRRDLHALGEIVEANALAMHGCMLAARPGLLYWAPATLAVLRAVRDWRARGLAVYATIDAGPHPALLGRREDLERIARRARALEGVTGVIRCLPGGGAEVIERS